MLNFSKFLLKFSWIVRKIKVKHAKVTTCKQGLGIGYQSYKPNSKTEMIHKRLENNK